MNILIVKLSAIGDVIHTLPSLNAIRKKFPDARITWVIEEAALPIIEGHKALDQVLVSRRKTWIKEMRTPKRGRALQEIAGFIKKLRSVQYDMVIDFQALLKSGVLVALAKGNRKIGFGRGMEHMEHSYLFFNERVPAVDMDNHAILRSLMLLDALSIHSREIVYDLPVQDSDRRKAEELLAENGLENAKTLAAVNPVAQWPTKLWQNEKFSILADRLIDEKGVGLFFTGGPDDKSTSSDIMSRMTCKAVDFTGKTTLKTLAALYEKADFLVTTDTGPMHLAAAAGLPVIAIFGPTAPWRTGPFGSGHCVIRSGLDCSPCFKRHCNTLDCMKLISVEDVMEGISGLGVFEN